ncbi:MAG: hypothetical protein EOO40_01445, partial [Deltaproteobacteria bacterium]
MSSFALPLKGFRTTSLLPSGALARRLGWLWPLSLRAPHRQFLDALQRPQQVQAALLKRLLKGHAHTAYGRAHGLPQIDSLAAFQAHVPLVDQDALEPWIAQVAAGVAQVLTAEPVLWLQGGGAGGRGAVPVTASLLQRHAALWQSFLRSWVVAQPELGRGRLYWETQAPTNVMGAGPTGIDVPSSMTGLVGELTRQRLLTAAGGQRAILLALLQADDLSGMILGNPANAAGLVAALHEELPDLLRRLPAARAAHIRTALDTQGVLSARVLWPKLQRITLWR